jgi:hypothetical protein
MEYALEVRVLILKIHISLAKMPQREIIKYGFIYRGTITESLSEKVFRSKSFQKKWMTLRQYLTPSQSDNFMLRPRHNNVLTSQTSSECTETHITTNATHAKLSIVRARISRAHLGTGSSRGNHFSSPTPKKGK